MHPVNETQIEWMARTVPNGKRCGGCGNISGGKCRTWGHLVDSNSLKCDECIRTLEGQLWGIKRAKVDEKNNSLHNSK